MNAFIKRWIKLLTTFVAVGLWFVGTLNVAWWANAKFPGHGDLPGIITLFSFIAVTLSGIIAYILTYTKGDPL